jgi:hypothetical protein
MKDHILDRTEAMHERLGTAGFVLSLIAIVLALTGGAYAASKLNGTQKKEVEKIAKKFAGKPGAPGAAGTAGTNGTNGKDGAPGAPGAAGKSVVVGSFDGENEPTGEPCEELGGSELEVEDSGNVTYTCNGKEGSPWTAGGKLPKGALLSGGWSVAVPKSASFVGMAPTTISFGIPLASGLDESHVHFQGEANFATNCPGTLENPTAISGHLCVYSSGVLGSSTAPYIAHLDEAEGLGASPEGAQMLFPFDTSPTPAENVVGRGSWAVRG